MNQTESENMTKTTQEPEYITLINERSNLALQKVEIEHKLANIKNLIRSSGLMPNDKYQQCVDSQRKHRDDVFRIQKRLCEIGLRLRELDLISKSSRVEAQTPPADLNTQAPIVSELCALREHYQSFSSDLSRVSSMRAMAAEFVGKLNPIIRHAVSPNANAR
jgi:hypothetical protein